VKVFLATSAARQHLAALDRASAPRRLLSYKDLRAPGVRRKLDAAGSLAEALRMKVPLEVILDSGAFSAWNSQGRNRRIVVTFEEYAAFVVRYSKFFDWVVNLDVIPGEWGRVPSAAEVDKVAAIGWERYYELKRRLSPEEGGKLIHVYHQNEHMRWLTKLLDEGGAYVGISPGNDCTRHDRDDWLESLRPHLTEDRGQPIARFHGFGVTSPDILERHLWLYSVDSTSWVKSSRRGSCYIPFRDKNGRVRSRVIPFSGDHPEAQPRRDVHRTAQPEDARLARLTKPTTSIRSTSPVRPTWKRCTGS
jgi:hypothetical protein